MFGTNFRNAYEFDPETQGASSLGGLPGLLRQVMLQQGLQQQGINSGSAPNAAPGQNLESYGNPKGLIGRILALQADQPGAFGDDARQPQYPPPDVNSGQPSGAMTGTRTPGTIHLSSRFEQQSNPTYPASGEGALRGASPTAVQGAGSFETRDGPQAPTRVADASMNMTPFAWRGRGIPIPVPLPGSGTGPEIPMPKIPDWWRDAWAILQLYPRVFSGKGGGGGDDENDCLEETRKVRQKCIEAFPDDWPYNSPSWKPQTIEECTRGLLSVRCGGLAEDTGKGGRGPRRKGR